MSFRFPMAVVAVLTLAAPLMAAPSHSSIPSKLRETRALDAELARLSSESRASASMLYQVRKLVRSARTDVDRARKVVAAIRYMETRIGRLNHRIQPLMSVPKVRTMVRILSMNLKKLHKVLRPIRQKADRFDKQVLSPLRKKLVNFDRKLYVAHSKLVKVINAVGKLRTQLAQSAKLAVKNSSARRTLERASRNMRPTVARLTGTVRSANSKASAVRGNLNSLRSGLAAFWTVERSLNAVSRKLKPSEKVVGDLHRVLSKRISIRLPIPPFKKVGFSIRDILVKPGQILNIVLKPLEKLADKALQPLLKKTKLQIQPPRGLNALARSLDRLPSLSRRLNASINSLERFLTNELNRQADQFISLAGRGFSVAGRTRR